MAENRARPHSFFNILIGMGAFLIGISLVVVGSLVLIHAAYMTWELYKNPDAIIGFAQSLKIADSSIEMMDLNGLDPLRLLAWPFAVMILLLQGKISLWAIEGGARLLDVARQK